MKCEKCLTVRAAMGGQTPRGWAPFAWGPSGEEPLHFYVFPEDTPDSAPGTAQEVPTTKLCEVADPERRYQLVGPCVRGG